VPVNLFAEKKPVAPSAFYGRYEVVERLTEQLAAPNGPNSVLLHGPPKIGKTSLLKFLWAIAHRDDQEEAKISADRTESGQKRCDLMRRCRALLNEMRGYVFVPYDCSSAIYETEERFVKELCLRLEKAVQAAGVPLPPPSEEGHYSRLAEVSEISAKEGQKLIFLLDECDTILPPDERKRTLPDDLRDRPREAALPGDGRGGVRLSVLDGSGQAFPAFSGQLREYRPEETIATALFPLLAVLIQQEKAALVMASRRPLDSISGRLGKLPELLFDFPLGPFTREEAEEFIRDASEKAGLPLGDYVDPILRAGGLHPCLLSLTCSSLF